MDSVATMPALTGLEFDELFRAHVESVRRYARWLTGSSDVDDIVGTTFATAWRRRDDIPSDAVRPWLLGVTRNVVRASQRSDRRRARLTEAAMWAARADAPEPASDLLVSLQEAFRQLPDTDREVLGLVAWFELTPKEAARVLELPSAVLRVRLHRARRHLRAVYDAGDGSCA